MMSVCLGNSYLPALTATKTKPKKTKTTVDFEFRNASHIEYLKCTHVCNIITLITALKWPEGKCHTSCVQYSVA